MGYYVATNGGRVSIRKENYQRGFELLCALNARDELKRGGHHPAELERPSDSSSVAKDPNKWFAWMPWNYDEVCHGLIEILEMVGFEVVEDETGITDITYDNKTGDETEFLKALAPVVESGSYIEWSGEEYGDLYRYEFDEGVMTIRIGNIVWE